MINNKHKTIHTTDDNEPSSVDWFFADLLGKECTQREAINILIDHDEIEYNADTYYKGIQL